MIAEFLKENIVKNNASTVMLADIQGAYRVWLMQRGFQPLGRHAIIEALKKEGYMIGRGEDNVYSVVGISCYPLPYTVLENGKLIKTRPQPVK